MSGPFGFSLLLDDGDLVLSEGSLAEVSGVDNLTQALTVRVLTPDGSDRFNTTYGLDVTQALAGPHDRRMVRELLRLNLVRTLAADPRVREVREIVFADDTEEGRRRIQTVEVIVETVTGDTATLFVETPAVRRS